jgi:Chromate transporter
VNPESNSAAHEPTKVSLAQFVGYFLWLGTVGFGGPIALAVHMQQDLVDDRGWVRKENYLEGLAEGGPPYPFKLWRVPRPSSAWAGPSTSFITRSGLPIRQHRSTAQPRTSVSRLTY